MEPWTQSPEAAALLAGCAAIPPPHRLSVFRFQETASRFVGPRMARLRRLYLQAEPPIDTPQWRAWLALDPQRAVTEAIARGPAPGPSNQGPSQAEPMRRTSPWPATAN